MGRAHGASKQQRPAPSPHQPTAASSAPVPSMNRAFGGSKSPVSGVVSKKSLFDDEGDTGGGDDMFFDAKKGKELKAERAIRVKLEGQEPEVKLQVNKVFAEKFAAVEKLKDGMRLKSLEEKYGQL
jgi:hypothetical protein